MEPRYIPEGRGKDLIVKYINDNTNSKHTSDLSQVIGIFNDDNQFKGAVLVSGYRDIDCELSTASSTPLVWTEEVLRHIFNYIFRDLGCIRCTAITTQKNKKAKAFLTALNFKYEGRMRKALDGENDAIIYGLLRDDCIYIQERIM